MGIEYSEEPLVQECTKDNCLDAMKKVESEKDNVRSFLVSACVREDWQKAEVHRKKLDSLIKIGDRLRNILNRVSNKR